MHAQRYNVNGKYAIIATAFLCACLETCGKVLQSYVVHNRYQCQRLCWYRVPCVAFSVPDDVTGADGEVNCLLHTGAANGVVPQGWALQRATDEDIQRGCRSRPCTASQICVPVSGFHFHYLCLEAPVDCGVPTPPANGRFNWTGTSPGHSATLTCQQHYQLFPKGAATVITCTKAGTWTTLEVLCQRVSYGKGHSVPFLARLPVSLTPGWEACIKGRFLGGGQFIVNFLSDQEDYPQLPITKYRNIIAQLAFRDSMEGLTQSLLYAEKRNMRWTTIAVIGGNPLRARGPFSLGLYLNASCLSVLLHGTDFSTCLPGPDRVQLFSTVYIGIARNLELLYVSLLSSRECLLGS